MRRILISLVLLGVCMAGCRTENNVEAEIEAIPVSVVIKRFDQDFGKAKAEDLGRLKKQYPYLFPAQFPDSIWIQKMQDSIQHELYAEVSIKYPTTAVLKGALEDFYKHAKYYFSLPKVPTVITLTSDVDYNQRIIETDSLLIIGLDNYLGSDHKFYERIQRFHTKNMDEKNIISDVASAFIQRRLPAPKDRTLLAQMIAYGKELYVKSLLIPGTEDYLKIGYTPEEFSWAQANESEIWRYFVDRELLFSTDPKLTARFINPAPFSKFYLELDNESPGMIGRFIGWQIVSSYMKNNSDTLQKMLGVPAEELFKNAKYKPKK